MKNTDDTSGESWERSICSAGRIVAAVVCAAPLTIPSASPHAVIAVPAAHLPPHQLNEISCVKHELQHPQCVTRTFLHACATNGATNGATKWCHQVVPPTGFR